MRARRFLLRATFVLVYTVWIAFAGFFLHFWSIFITFVPALLHFWSIIAFVDFPYEDLYDVIDSMALSLELLPTDRRAHKNHLTNQTSRPNNNVPTPSPTAPTQAGKPRNRRKRKPRTLSL